MHPEPNRVCVTWLVVSVIVLTYALATLCFRAFGDEHIHRLIRYVTTRQSQRSPSPTEETCQKMIRSYCHNSRVRAVKVLSLIGSIILLVFQMTWIKQTIYCESTWVSSMQRSTLLVLSVAMGIFHLTSRCTFSEAFLDFVFISGMVAAILLISPIYVTGDIIEGTARALRPMRGLMPLLSLNVRHIVAGNTFFMAVLLWSISFHKTYEVLTTSFADEIIVSVVSSLIGWLAREFAAFAGKKQLDINVAARSLHVAHKMLNYFCDVVTELDSNLQFPNHSPQLAATLLLNPERSLKGLKFKELVSEAEQEKVERDLSELLTTDTSHAHVFKASMRDSNGTDVVVDVFTVAFVDPFEVRRILLGIREVSQEMLQFNECSDNSSVVERGDSCPRDGYVGDEDIANERYAVLNADSLSSLPRMHTTHRECSSRQRSHASWSTAGALAYPHFRETSREAKLISLLELFCSWNARISARCCCRSHAIIKEVERMMRTFVALKCDELSLGTFSHQCSECGILRSVLLTSTCESCGCGQDDGWDAHSKTSGDHARGIKSITLERGGFLFSPSQSSSLSSSLLETSMVYKAASTLLLVWVVISFVVMAYLFYARSIQGYSGLGFVETYWTVAVGLLFSAVALKMQTPIYFYWQGEDFASLTFTRKWHTMFTQSNDSFATEIQHAMLTDIRTGEVPPPKLSAMMPGRHYGRRRHRSSSWGPLQEKSKSS